MQAGGRIDLQQQIELRRGRRDTGFAPVYGVDDAVRVGRGNGQRVEGHAVDVEDGEVLVDRVVVPVTLERLRGARHPVAVVHGRARITDAALQRREHAARQVQRAEQV